MSHSPRYVDAPASIVLDGTRYACSALLRCACGLLVAHYRDPDRPRLAPLAAYGRSLSSLTPSRRLPPCELTSHAESPR